MGRPPIGKKAMTSAERQRRYLDRIRSSGAPKQSDAAASDKLKELTLENMSMRQQLRDALARIPKRSRPARPPLPVDEQVKRLRLQLAAARARIREFIHGDKGIVYLSSANRRKILAALHPDHISDPALKKRHEVAFQIFTNLPIAEIDID